MIKIWRNMPASGPTLRIQLGRETQPANHNPQITKQMVVSSQHIDEISVDGDRIPAIFP